MPQLLFEFVSFAAGPHRRQPRASSSDGGFAPIGAAPVPIPVETGQPFTVPMALIPTTLPDGDATYVLSYVNVSGGTQGGQTTFNHAQPPASVTIGSANIVVLAVYVPEGGGSGDGFGATIDAFDETTGTLVSDTFVTATPDNGQTSEGNVFGYVVTTTVTETIAALSVITPTNADFDKWVDLQSPSAAVPGVTIAGADLTVAKGTSVSALAFYKAPPPPPPPSPCQSTLAYIAELSHLGKIPVTEVPGLKAQLLQCLTEKKISQAQYEMALNELEHPTGIQTPPTPGPTP